MTQRVEVSVKPNIISQQVNPRLIAFYLTQFHPTPENDLWWGKGFTEWTNVTKSKPLFDGHYQPHLPTDFGFYDLRVRETRRDQIKTAKQYGIDGFCYHYYWFSGKRILNAPLDDMLADPDSDMPFCLCWANENWTRRWDAADHQILIAQKYAAEDDLNFIKSLIPFFNDPRYIKINDAPFLIVYRPQHLPDANKSLNIWREYCKSIGIPKLHIVCALTHGNLEYEQYGFDGGVEFPPHNLEGIKNVVQNNNLSFANAFGGMVCQYEEIANLYLNRVYSEPNVYKTVFPSWDNTARTGARAFVTLNGTPENYNHWLSKTIELDRQTHPGEERLLFINAWNEWAEGCHLEPDRKYGHQFLEATLKAKTKDIESKEFPDTGLPEQSITSDVNLLHDIFTINPKRLKPGQWMGHAPFVGWLIKAFKPKIVVELGTRNDGNSLCLINQAIQSAGYKAKTYGYSGLIESERNFELLEYLQENYPFSNLTYGEINFKKHVDDFENSSIDILHLNDLRSAEIVRQLLQLWLPKLSTRAVVLVHNTNWLGAQSDVHVFWEENKTSGIPALSFLHSHGLGVLLMGQDRFRPLLEMSDTDENNSIWLKNRMLFEQAGNLIEQKSIIEQLQTDVLSVKSAVTGIEQSKTWRLTGPIRKVAHFLSRNRPPQT